MAEWSYAFRRMRILFGVAAAIGVRLLSSVCWKLRTASLRAKGGPQACGARPTRPPPGAGGGGGARGGGGGGGTVGVMGLLLVDLGDAPRADGAAPLADGDPEALVHGDRLDE